jgi:hypothetical protein
MRYTGIVGYYSTWMWDFERRAKEVEVAYAKK